MKYNRLGTSGLFVSELSFGTMTFGEMEGQPTLGGLTQQDASALVAKAFEAGVNLFDTADVYALGDSERFLGEALRNLGVPVKPCGHSDASLGNVSWPGKCAPLRRLPGNPPGRPRPLLYGLVTEWSSRGRFVTPTIEPGPKI